MKYELRFFCYLTQDMEASFSNEEVNQEKGHPLSTSVRET